jgi:hypothetical protein
MRYTTLKTIHETLAAELERLDERRTSRWEAFAIAARDRGISLDEFIEQPEGAALYDEYDQARADYNRVADALDDLNDHDWS